MNEIQVFNYQGKEARTIEIGGDTWWVLKDVCDILDVKNNRDVVTRLDDDEKADVDIIDTSSNGVKQSRTVTAINEPGLYNVILQSRKPEAKAFKRWVTHEVLPSIHKHGLYAKDELLDNPDLLLDVIQRYRAERAERLLLEQKVAEYEPKAEYLDKILQSNGTLTITQIAADYGLSAKTLNKILHEEHIQHSVGGQWILYREHMNLGYTKSSTIHFEHSDGTPDTKLQTKWTQKGRLMIHNLLVNRGIKANMDREKTG